MGFAKWIGQDLGLREKALGIAPGLLSTCAEMELPVFMGAPADGSVFLASTNIPLAVDLNGEIEFSTVAYRANDQVIATDSGPVFSAVWSNAPVGSYVLRATARR